MHPFQEGELSQRIIGAAIEVHKVLGPGLLESAYKSCLSFEFENLGLQYKQELLIPFIYKNKQFDCGYRLDFLVEDKILIELKSTEAFLPIHKAQLLTYMRLMNRQIGLLINFNSLILKEGIRRCVLNAPEPENQNV